MTDLEQILYDLADRWDQRSERILDYDPLTAQNGMYRAGRADGLEEAATDLKRILGALR